jgi:hypothetical protein
LERREKEEVERLGDNRRNGVEKSGKGPEELRGCVNEDRDGEDLIGEDSVSQRPRRAR